MAGASTVTFCHHATGTLLKRVAGAYGNPRLHTEDQVAPKGADSTSSTSPLVGPRLGLRAKVGARPPLLAKKNASPSSRNRTSDQLISCIYLYSQSLYQLRNTLLLGGNSPIENLC